ncbi:hypothetical protein BpHYR1_032056 [Brachionus plicatilis]|uniref:Uncharacterized protein n=1 Tax=Brachionus plicatilis TaxID=10195 RepID=A0A3M7RVN9_BRAPC|nr:hypothetical protein BpHYR1_032056 [Brachionus plicatilis]
MIVLILKFDLKLQFAHSTHSAPQTPKSSHLTPFGASSKITGNFFSPKGYGAILVEDMKCASNIFF